MVGGVLLNCYVTQTGFFFVALSGCCGVLRCCMLWLSNELWTSFSLVRADARESAVLVDIDWFWLLESCLQSLAVLLCEQATVRLREQRWQLYTHVLLQLGTLLFSLNQLGLEFVEQEVVGLN